ncbi:MAG: isoprenylcysteine carboxylmethyltransferase family protein [Acidobacteriota bacterium]
MGRERSKILGYVRIALLYLFIILLAILAKPTPTFFYVGMVFVALGEAFRFWAAGHLIKSKELIVSGPYRYTQHPLYLGRFLILTGLCIMAKLPYLLNFALLTSGYLVFFLYYLPRKIKVEGERLREIHGEKWMEYRKHVPALFPQWKPYGEQKNGWSSQRMLRNREHFMIIGLIIILVVFLLKSYPPQP